MVITMILALNLKVLKVIEVELILLSFLELSLGTIQRLLLYTRTTKKGVATRWSISWMMTLDELRNMLSRSLMRL